MDSVFKVNYKVKFTIYGGSESGDKIVEDDGYFILIKAGSERAAEDVFDYLWYENDYCDFYEGTERRFYNREVFKEVYEEMLSSTLTASFGKETGKVEVCRAQEKYDFDAKDYKLKVMKFKKMLKQFGDDEAIPPPEDL
ncbi:MAG: hypothetical protein PHF33_06710 [Candidatus Delongbacteria bacterium]|nr:hypothetical protein [Candidatus Delongbacteria bacterium]